MLHSTKTSMRKPQQTSQRASPSHCIKKACAGPLYLTRPVTHPAAALTAREDARPSVVTFATTTATVTYQTQVVEVPRGDTAGAAMALDEVCLQAGDRDLMMDVSWRVLPGQRWGLVGSNGCGKSTLLRALCGIRPIDAGRILVAPKVEVGYLAQTAVSGSTKTVWQEAMSQMTSLNKASDDIDAAEKALENGEEGAAEALAQAQEDFAMAGGWDADKRVATVLTGLGFRQEQFHVPASEFSGGWQMRIALARLLLGEAGQAAAAGLQGGLMLLDEPTNHLDSAAIKWLGNFLKASGGTLVVVSHDEALLETVCDHIAEVRGKKLHTYTGSYRAFLEQRAEREKQAIATAAAQQAEIERLEAFVKRFGAKATKASAAQSKAKLAEKLRAEMVEIPTAASSEGGGDAKKVTLKLPPAPPCFTDVLIMKNASVGWGDPTAEGAAPMLTGVDLTVKKGQRILVLGPNGAGKSTLLKTMSGSIPLWEGERKEGEGVKLGVFSQDLAQDLPLQKSGLEYVQDTARAHDPKITLEKCRQALGALGLTNSMVNQPIGVLSGGEKARVALAAFALVPANVLLLDEASNHLDAATIKVLTGALQDFRGAIVAITHNPSFANSLNATHILRVQAGQAKLSTNMGLTDADFEHPPSAPVTPSSRAATPGPSKGSNNNTKTRTPSPSPAPEAVKAAASAPTPTPTPSPAPSATPAPAAAAAAAKKRTTLSWKEQEEYKKLGKEMEVLGKKRDVLQAKVTELAAGSDFKSMEAASLELGSLVEKLETMEVRWLELAELAGDI